MSYTSSAVYKAVKSCIERVGRSPYLFLGSGFSRRYAGTDSWEGLLRHLCALVNDNPFYYDVLAAEAAESGGDINPGVATLLNHVLTKTILSDPSYEEFRSRNEILIKSGCPIIKIAAAERVRSFEPCDNMEEFAFLKSMAHRKISGIITTNYDQIADNLFSDFEVFVGQEDLLFNPSFGIGEIYKIHGSVTKPSSLILDKHDYDAYEEKQAYLSAKLLTIFAENPVIFIGYSISDPNIRSLLKSLAKCVGPDNLNFLRDRLLFVTRGQDEASPYTMSFEGVGDIEMTRISTNDFKLVYKAINDCETRYAPRVLRQLRQSIYKLASEVDPTSNIAVTGFEQIDSIPDNLNIVLGIAAVSSHHHGHVVKADHLYEDVVLDNKYLDPTLTVEEYLPDLLRTNAGGLPMYKYLSVYRPAALQPKVMELLDKRQTLDDFLNAQLVHTKNNFRAERATLSVEAIVEEFGLHEAYKKLYFLEANEIDLDSLKHCLVSLLTDGDVTLRGNSELKRLIRIYDFLKYGSAVDKSSNSGA